MIYWFTGQPGAGKTIQANKKDIRALLVNTRNANAYTGKQGLNSIIELAKFFSDKKKISNKQILFASTGVIGQPFPLAKVKGALPNLIEKLKAKSQKDEFDPGSG